MPRPAWIEACCPYCGEIHDRAEDAACGCGCGDEPSGCGACMRQGGPPVRYTNDGRRTQVSYDEEADLYEMDW